MLTGVSGRAGTARAGDGPGQRPRRPRRTRRAGREPRAVRGWRSAGVAGLVVLLFCCAEREARQLGVQSDGAGMVLEARAMLHGNLLLHGWHLTDVSFYTTELPEYMLVELVRGLNPDVVRLCAALTYTLLVVLAAAVAYGSRPADNRAAMVRAGIAVAVMLAPTVAAANVLLNDADHTGTAVPVLLALLALDRAGRRWWAPVIVAVVLGWALVGDSLLLLIGVAPLVIVGGGRAFGKLALRGQPLAAARYDLSLAAAGVAAAIGGTTLSALIKAAGGYRLSPQGTRAVIGYQSLPGNAAALVNNFLDLFSADFFGVRLNDWLAVIAVHLVFASLVALALFLALRACSRNFLHGDLVAQLLAVAIAVNLAGYLLLYPATGSTAREIAPVFGLGGALAGRMLAEPLLRRRLEPLLAVGAVAAVVALLPPLLTVKPTPPAAAGLARFLAARHLDSGLAGYWNANSTTLDSGDRVVVRTVQFRRRRLVAYAWEIDTRLYAGSADFLVATGPRAPSPVTPAEGVAAFGRPYREYRYQGYTIMVWRKNLLRDLGAVVTRG